MLWAAWTIGLLTFFASVIGVRYIYLTLVSTQEMARETIRIGEAQVACHVTVEVQAIQINVIGPAPELAALDFGPKIQNGGNTAAFDVSYVFDLSLIFNNDRTVVVRYASAHNFTLGQDAQNSHNRGVLSSDCNQIDNARTFSAEVTSLIRIGCLESASLASVVRYQDVFEKSYTLVGEYELNHKGGANERDGSFGVWFTVEHQKQHKTTNG